jgi:hypothetical protein
MQGVPSRRIDIACYTPSAQHGLSPLLLVECKAATLTHKTLSQASGYNYYLAAPFLTLASANAIYTGCYDITTYHYQFSPGLPPYQTLLALRKIP